MAIEALVQETLGMTDDPVLNEIAQWAKEIAVLTTEAASASGQYDNQYPGMAVKARDLRKRLMGTVKIETLLPPDLTEKVNNKVTEIVGQTVDE